MKNPSSSSTSRSGRAWVVVVASLGALLSACSAPGTDDGTTASDTSAITQVCQPGDCPDQGYSCKVVHGAPRCTPEPPRPDTGAADASAPEGGGGISCTVPGQQLCACTFCPSYCTANVSYCLDPNGGYCSPNSQCIQR